MEEERHAASLRALDDGRTRISIAIDHELEGPVEKAGGALGVVGRRVEGDLRRFKDFIDSRGGATGAWRGEIHGGRARDGDSSDLDATGTDGSRESVLRLTAAPLGQAAGLGSGSDPWRSSRTGAARPNSGRTGASSRR
jgi:hypothetical protein